jgi:hypothetical protein
VEKTAIYCQNSDSEGQGETLEKAEERSVEECREGRKKVVGIANSQNVEVRWRYHAIVFEGPVY